MDIGHIGIKVRVPAFEVVIGMIADGMACLKHLRKDIRMLVDILPHHEESSLDIISREDRQDLRRDLRNRAVVESQIYICTRTEHAVRVQFLPYISEFYHARDEAPSMAASLSLRMEIDTGILPFHIGMRFSSNASRIGSMIQCPDLVRPPKRMIASGLEKWT